MQTNKILQEKSSWDNVYWFARMLINSDKYGGIGRDNKLLTEISSLLRITQDNASTETIALQKKSLENFLISKYKEKTKVYYKALNFFKDIDEKLNSKEDIEAFIITCEKVMMPINLALKNIPNDDKEYTKSIAKAYLDLKGKNGVAEVVSLWDDLGVRGCLTAERTEVVREFSLLRKYLSGVLDLQENDKDVILTAFVQEFERRIAQKRKGRAGGSLEDVTDFILNYYAIPSAVKPEHFQADMEVDNWIKTKDGWLIGISCKRTLRERWKQVSSGNADLLSRFKIKFIYHVITFDEDLSDDKLTLLGSQRHIFYLSDTSRRFQVASKHVGLKNYVRPMSKFIDDITSQI